MEGSGLCLELPHLIQARQVSDHCSPRLQPGSAVDLGLVGLPAPEQKETRGVNLLAWERDYAFQCTCMHSN